MLKLTLTPGANLDRVLESVSRSFLSLLEEAGRSGVLRIYSYLNPDPLVAASMVFLKAVSVGVEPVVTLALNPPAVVEEPSVLLGFGNLDYKSSDVKSKLLAFYSGELKSVPVHGATYVDGQGSVSAMVYLSLTGGREYDLAYVTAALAGSYLSRFVDRQGRFHGLDRVVLDKLRLATRLSLEMVTTLKGYKPASRDACESLSVTSSPYYPSLTGDYELCIKTLQTRNLSHLLGVKLASLDQKSLEALVAAVADVARRVYNADLDPGELVGGILVSTSPESPVVDFREAADALTYISEAVMDPGRLIATLVDVENEYPIVEARLEGYASRLNELIRGVKPAKMKGGIKTQFYSVQLGAGDSPSLVWRALRALKLVEQESVLVFESEGGHWISPFQVEEALGYGGCRRLVEQGLAELREGYLWAGRKLGV